MIAFSWCFPLYSCAKCPILPPLSTCSIASTKQDLPDPFSPYTTLDLDPASRVTLSAREKYPEAKPRIISDNGPQFIARDFKEFIRIAGMTHVRTSPYYPQSNGKLERWHKSLKSECIRPGTPLSLEDARRLIQQDVGRYNYLRL